MEKNIKDNLVPSLDSELINILNYFLDKLSEAYNKKYPSHWKSEKEYAKNLLQNGVETDKERPKNGIYYEGNYLNLKYEEIVDLISHYHKTGSGDTLSRKKCDVYGVLFPYSNY